MVQLAPGREYNDGDMNEDANKLINQYPLKSGLPVP